jgi:glycosyltransferase EpsD
MKIIFISTIAIFSRFNIPFMRWFKEQGWQVDYASDGASHISDCDNQFKIDIKRSPYNLVHNIKAYFQLKNILKHGYDIIHCDTPMGGVLGRLAARRTRGRVIYIAHGFHFYKGAPLINWLLYYPMEKYLAKLCDIIIVLNDEDYNFAKANFSNCKQIYKINGVGVDLKRFYPHSEQEKTQLRKELGFSAKDFIITNVAEINKNKNQIILIKAVPILKKYIPNIKVLLIGNNNYSNTITKIKIFVKHLQLQTTVEFLGYRNDVEKLIAISNIAFSASFREGLPVNIVESMASGIPVVCSRNRGHNSLITDKVSGLLFSVNNQKEMIDSIISIYKNPDLGKRLGTAALMNSEKYSIDIAINNMADIYRQLM